MAGTKNAPRHLDWLGSISGDDVKCGMSRLVALVHTPRVYLQFLHFSSLHKNLNSRLQLGSGKQETKSRFIEGPLRNFTFFIFYILRWVPHRHIRDYVFTLLYFIVSEPGLVEVSLVLKYTPDVDEESVLKLCSREDSSTDEETRGIKHTKSAKDSLVDGVINLCSPVQVCIMPKALRWKRTGWITTFKS